MKIVTLEIQVPDDKIHLLSLLCAYIRKKLSAEYRVIRPRADVTVVKSKGFVD